MPSTNGAAASSTYGAAAGNNGAAASASNNNDAGVVSGKTYQTSSTSSVLTPYNEVRLPGKPSHDTVQPCPQVVAAPRAAPTPRMLVPSPAAAESC